MDLCNPAVNRVDQARPGTDPAGPAAVHDPRYGDACRADMPNRAETAKRRAEAAKHPDMPNRPDTPKRPRCCCITRART
ncbi:hypothetical protein GCM10010193_30930 [Kitasatospora atroaurantiaca]